MSYNIQRAAVIGAGIMGAGIAAHLANAGIPVLLLDIVAPDAQNATDRTARNRVAQTGLERAIKAKPASAFYTQKSVKLVTVGNTEDDLAKLGEVDWIVEAVFEQLDIKRDLYARVEAVRRPGTIISSNTSGLPATMLLEGRSEDFRRHFLITHFFNPHGAARQGRRLLQGSAELHRQPYRHLWLHGNHPPHARRGLSHRGGGRDSRPADGAAQVGGVPNSRSRGHRYAGTRRR
jgi:choline dehydrogenase-like flavoprotein